MNEPQQLTLYAYIYVDIFNCYHNNRIIDSFWSFILLDILINNENAVCYPTLCYHLSASPSSMLAGAQDATSVSMFHHCPLSSDTGL